MTPQFLSEMPPSQNPNTGRSVTIATKAPPELLSAIVEVIERGKTSPYENVSAFVRGAIHRLVLELSPGIESPLLPPIIALLKEWSRREFEFRCYEQVIEGMKHNAHMLEVYVQHGDTGRATETLEEIAKDIMNLKDDFWRRVCLRELFKFSVVGHALEDADGKAPSAIMAYEVWKERQV